MAWFGNLRQRMMGMGGLPQQMPVNEPMQQEPIQDQAAMVEQPMQPEPMQQPVQESMGLSNLKQQMMAQKAAARSSGRLGGMGAPIGNRGIFGGLAQAASGIGGGMGMKRPMGQPIQGPMQQIQGPMSQGPRPTFNQPMMQGPMQQPMDPNNMRTGAIGGIGQRMNRGFNPYRNQMRQQSQGQQQFGMGAAAGNQFQ